MQKVDPIHVGYTVDHEGMSWICDKRELSFRRCWIHTDDQGQEIPECIKRCHR